MIRAALVFTGLTAALQFYIAWFEIFAWTTRGPTIFSSFPPDLFAQTTEMAANQGLYNAFLGVGLVWVFLIRDAHWQRNVAICFLLFVVTAGVFAAFTVDVRPGLVQAVPSAIGLILFSLARPRTKD